MSLKKLTRILKDSLGFPDLKEIFSAIGISESDGPKCPSCTNPLKKMPKRSVTCKKCGKRINLMIRPYDNQPVLLNNSDSFRIKQEIDLSRNKERLNYYLDARNELTKEFGAIPKHNDIMWRVFNKEKLALEERGEFSRGIECEMIEALLHEAKFDQVVAMALKMCCEDMLTLYGLYRKNKQSKWLYDLSISSKTYAPPTFGHIAGALRYFRDAQLGSGKDVEYFKKLFTDILKRHTSDFIVQPNIEESWNELVRQLNELFASQSQK